MKFVKRKPHKRLSRTDADILAARNYMDDQVRGIKIPFNYYDEQSDLMCKKQSRNIYTED